MQQVWPAPPQVPQEPSAPQVDAPAQVWPVATHVPGPELPTTQQPPVQLLPGQQGAPGIPHLRQVVVVEKVLGVPLQTVSVLVHALPVTQQACPTAPQVQVPPEQVPYGVDVQASPARRQMLALQQLSPSHLLPGQQGACAVPHLTQLLVESHTSPVSLQTLPGQHGPPMTPHLVQICVEDEQTVSGLSHALVVEPVVVVETGQHGCPARPQLQRPLLHIP